MKNNEQIINELKLTFSIDSDVELADLLDTSKQNISHWRNNGNVNVRKLKEVFPKININYILTNGQQGNLLIDSPRERLLTVLKEMDISLDEFYTKTNIVPGLLDDVMMDGLTHQQMRKIENAYPFINRDYIMYGKNEKLIHMTADVVAEDKSNYGDGLNRKVKKDLSDKFGMITTAIESLRSTMLENQLIEA